MNIREEINKVGLHNYLEEWLCAKNKRDKAYAKDNREDNGEYNGPSLCKVRAKERKFDKANERLDGVEGRLAIVLEELVPMLRKRIRIDIDVIDKFERQVGTLVQRLTSIKTEIGEKEDD